MERVRYVYKKEDTESLQKVIDELQKENDKLKKENKKIWEDRNQQAKDSATFSLKSSALELELGEIKKRHEEEISKLKNDSDSIESLQKQLYEATNESARWKEKYEDAIDIKNKSYQKKFYRVNHEKNQLQIEHDKLVDELNKEKAAKKKLREKHDTLKQDMVNFIDKDQQKTMEIQETCEIEMGKLKLEKEAVEKEFEEFRVTSNEESSKLKAANVDLVNKNNGLTSQFEELKKNQETMVQNGKEMKRDFEQRHAKLQKVHNELLDKAKITDLPTEKLRAEFLEIVNNRKRVREEDDTEENKKKKATLEQELTKRGVIIVTCT